MTTIRYLFYTTAEFPVSVVHLLRDESCYFLIICYHVILVGWSVVMLEASLCTVTSECCLTSVRDSNSNSDSKWKQRENKWILGKNCVIVDGSFYYQAFKFNF